MIGKRIAHYKILQKLGEGGMREVYLAHDSRLNREVALKIVPEDFTGDPGRMARFEREARFLASLNHPHIAQVHGLEEEDGRRAIVLELVEGETLAERVSKGPVPLRQTLEIALQIGEALETAHEKGILHRDLKPANIKITPQGRVKVLDFGLASALQEPAAVDLTDSPTLTEPLTQAGAILGTGPYMAPEQASGRAADRRTDIWAFGCVLFEMLTGQRAFPGKTVPEVLAHVLKGEPDWAVLPEDTPPAIRMLLKRCLDKDPGRRYRSAADVNIALEDGMLSGAAEPAQGEAARPGNPWRRMLPWATAVLLAAAAWLAAWSLKPSPPAAVSRLVITLPPDQQFPTLTQPVLAISPTGRSLVYAAVAPGPQRLFPGTQDSLGWPYPIRGVEEGRQRLFLRPLDSLEAKAIPGTEDAVSPFFSPDGQWIGFFAGGRLKKVSINGGTPLTLAQAAIPGGASWNSQGVLALQVENTGGLRQISQEGEPIQILTGLKSGEGSHRWPEFLPDGTGVLFGSSPTSISWANSSIQVVPLAGGEPKNLVGGIAPLYVPTGHLLYVQRGTLMAAPFNPSELALAGAGLPVLGNIAQSTSTGAAQYSVSANGTLVYLAGGTGGNQRQLVWVSRDGKEQPLPVGPDVYQWPRISPDGEKVALTIGEEEYHIWVYDISADKFMRSTFEGTGNTSAVWTPDGSRIAYNSNREGSNLNLFWQPSDGSGTAQRLTVSDHLQGASSFSPDGRLLAIIDRSPQTGRDIWVLQLGSPGSPRPVEKAHPFLSTPFEETVPRFSPDGKWLAYSSDETGRREIYVKPYPGPGGKWQISTGGGQEPIWNPRGGELFYRSGSRVMAVEVDAGAGFSAGPPRVLFEGPYLLTPASFPYYDVSPDGQRFLMLKAAETRDSRQDQIHVVLNWFEELKRQVPVKGGD